MAIDLLGPLLNTQNDNQYIIFITDWYIKPTHAIPMSKTTSPYTAAVMINHWILPFEISNTILSDNVPQFVIEV